MNRILIIGLDGASPALVEKWSSSLPNLARLVKSGSSGILTSIVPPRSIPAWYCMATGMNPAKLGVFGFSQRLPGTYDYTFANLSYCRALTFWQWLNEYNRKTAVIHVPGTFPPHPVDGILVSGWPAPHNSGNLIYTHPSSYSRLIDKRLGQPFEFLSEEPMRLDNDEVVLAERLRITRMHGDVAYDILSSQAWDVGIVVLSPLDRASHQFWRHMDPRDPANDADVKMSDDPLRLVYEASDTQVGRLSGLLDQDDTVFIISDHGFGPAYRVFYINEWLRQRGYLVLKDTSRQATLTARLVGRLVTPLFRLNHTSSLFRRLAAPLKKRAFSNYIRDKYVRTKNAGLVRLNHLPVDWTRTRAYCPDEGSLYLNLHGRDPEGIVKPGNQAEDLIGQIMKDLRHIPDPQTGELVPVSLVRKEAIYNGPFLQDAPDLLVSMNDYTTEVMAEFGSDSLYVAAGARNGTHNMEGLFIAKGPGIAAGKRVDASLLDIAPTVLHMAGLPVPDETDGEVLLRLFVEDADVRQRPVQKRSGGAAVSDIEAYSEEERAQVEKQLRELGYLN